MELEKSQYRVSSVQFLVYNLFLTYSSTISQEVFFFPPLPQCYWDPLDPCPVYLLVLNCSTELIQYSHFCVLSAVRGQEELRGPEIHATVKQEEVKTRVVLQTNTVLRGRQVLCSRSPVWGSGILCVPEDCNAEALGIKHLLACSAVEPRPISK